MERRTFLGMAAGLLGLPCIRPATPNAGSTTSSTVYDYSHLEPTRPMRSKPYIEEGRPYYEEPPERIIESEVERVR